MQGAIHTCGVQKLSMHTTLFAGGLVQVGHFMVLPDVGGGAAAAFVLASMAPLLLCVWRRPDPARFAFYVALASLNRSSFCNSIVLYCDQPMLFLNLCSLLSADQNAL